MSFGDVLLGGLGPAPQVEESAPSEKLTHSAESEIKQNNDDTENKSNKDSGSSSEEDSEDPDTENEAENAKNEKEKKQKIKERSMDTNESKNTALLMEKRKIFFNRPEELFQDFFEIVKQSNKSGNLVTYERPLIFSAKEKSLFLHSKNLL